MNIINRILLSLKLKNMEKKIKSTYHMLRNKALSKEGPHHNGMTCRLETLFRVHRPTKREIEMQAKQQGGHDDRWTWREMLNFKFLNKYENQFFSSPKLKNIEKKMKNENKNEKNEKNENENNEKHKKKNPSKKFFK